MENTINNFEKQAFLGSAFKALRKVPKAIFKASSTAGNVVGKGIGNTISAGINAPFQAGSLLNKAPKMFGKNMPTISGSFNSVGEGMAHGVGTVADKTIKATAGAGALGLGSAANFIGRVGYHGIAKPIGTGMVQGARMTSNIVKAHPIAAPLTMATVGTIAYSSKDRYLGKKYLMETAQNQRYRGLKNSMSKMGSDKDSTMIEKTAFNPMGLLENASASTKLLAAALPLGMIVAKLFEPSAETMGKTLHKQFFPLDQRINAEEELARKELGIHGDYEINRRLDSLRSQESSRADTPIMGGILSSLIQNDPIIAQAVQNEPSRALAMKETMDTVYKFAPDLATNQQAAQSILRESAMSRDGSIGYQTIKALADAQKSISGGRY